MFLWVPITSSTPLLTSCKSKPLGGAVETELERAVHPERCPVCSAHSHGPSAGRCWLPLVTYVRRARGVLHGPGQGVPGPGGQAQQVAGGHGWVQLPQSHRAVFLWWVDRSGVFFFFGLLSSSLLLLLLVKVWKPIPGVDTMPLNWLKVWPLTLKVYIYLQHRKTKVKEFVSYRGCSQNFKIQFPHGDKEV